MSWNVLIRGHFVANFSNKIFDRSQAYEGLNNLSILIPNNNNKNILLFIAYFKVKQMSGSS